MVGKVYESTSICLWTWKAGKVVIMAKTADYSSIAVGAALNDSLISLRIHIMIILAKYWNKSWIAWNMIRINDANCCMCIYNLMIEF
jgi:hypothetical protein